MSATPSSDLIVQEPIFEQILARLRESILRGTPAPGQALRLKDIAQAYGTSLMPVREALHRLTAARLIVMHPRKGAVVTELDSNGLNDLFGQLKLLLPHVWAEAASHLLEHDRARLAELAAQLRDLSAVEPLDRNAFEFCAGELHQVALRRLGNDLITADATRDLHLARLWANALKLDTDHYTFAAMELAELAEAAAGTSAEALAARCRTALQSTHDALMGALMEG